MELCRMGDKVEQTAEAKFGSTVNQAGHDIHNHYGPQMNEIIQTIDYQVSRQFEVLLHKHAPALIKNEISKVEASVTEFKEKMSSKLSEQFELLKYSLNEDLAGEKLIEGVTDSNFQYLFKDCLDQVIRKKDKAPQDILVDLLINKIISDDNSNYLIDEAIEVLRYLNKNHVNFILLIDIIIYELSYRLNLDPNGENIDILKTTSLFQIKWTLNYFIKLNPSPVDLEYLTYKGLILDGKNYTKFSSIPESIINLCIPEKLKIKFDNSNEELLDTLLPELKVLLNEFGLVSPYDFNVLSKISNIIADKSRNTLIMSIQRYKEINAEERDEWSKSIILSLKNKGIMSLY